MAGARTKSVTLRVDVDVNRALDEFCECEALAKSLVVNSALATFLRAPGKARVDLIKDYVERAKKAR